MESNEKRGVIMGAVMAGIGLIILITSASPAIGTLSLIIGIIFVLISLNQAEKIAQGKMPNEAQRRQIEANTIAREKQEAINASTSDAPWERKYYTSPCPYCGHYKVRSANWDDKRASVAFWGGASDKIGKRYKCENCNEMWS